MIALIDHATKGGGYILALVLWHCPVPRWREWLGWKAKAND